MTLDTGFVNRVYRLTVQGVGIICKIIANLTYTGLRDKRLPCQSEVSLG